MTTILAIDPGKVTGVALWSDRDPLSLSSKELASPVDVVLHARASAQRGHELVCEQFVISQRTIKTAQDRTALEIIGWLTIEAVRNDWTLTMQTAAQGKGFATDDKLKALGWFNSTPDGHANDAARHVLVYIQQKHRTKFNELILPTLAPLILGDPT